MNWERVLKRMKFNPFALYNEAAGKRISNIQNKFEDDEEILIDLDKVNYWYHKAAEIYNKVALYNLGKFYEFCQGVGRNESRAFEFYKKSAHQGFIDAQYRLGYLYDHGTEIDNDKEKAFDLYKMAAEGGNVDAQKCLATLYEKGEGTQKIIDSVIY